MNSKKIKLHIIENGSDFQFARQRIGVDDRILAIKPEVVAECDYLNQQYILPETYFDETRAVDLGLENYSQANELLNDLYKIACPHIRQDDMPLLKISLQSCTYHLRRFLDYVIYYREVIETIIASGEFDSFVLYHNSAESRIRTWSHVLVPDLPYASLIAYALLDKQKLELYSLDEESTQDVIHFQWSHLKNSLRQILTLLYPTSSDKALKISNLAVIDEVIDGLHLACISLRPVDTLRLIEWWRNTKLGKRIWNKISLHRLNERYLLPVVKDFLEILFNKVFYELFDVVRLYNRCWDSRVRLCLSGTAVLPWNNVIIHLARIHGVIRCGFQHGGAYGYLGQGLIENFYSDLTHFDYFFTFGDGVTSYYETNKSRYVTSCAQSVSIGARKLKQRLSDQKSISTKIYYIPTSYNLRNLLWHYYPVNYYYRMQKAIIDVCAKHPNLDFVYKTHYKGDWNDPIEAYISRAGLSNIAIERERLCDVIDKAAMFIIDFPTTTLLETLQTRKHVISFADKKYIGTDDRAVELLKKRCFFYTDFEHFIDALDQTLAAGVFEEITEPNSEFLEQYGTGNFIVSPAGMAATYLKPMVEKNTPIEYQHEHQAHEYAEIIDHR
ncbi:hypothetical protein JW960_23535 [candidate division KSB1 bacterium]|nr:hypothetical protein [candidate division KSB1 bacterium]